MPLAPENCDKVVTKPAAFTAPDAVDIIEARSIGTDCSNAIVLLTVRNGKGEPLWAWATPHHWAGSRGMDGEPVKPEEMDAFLDSWATVSVDTTAALPDWPERDLVFANDLGAFMSTPFDRDVYLDVRNKALPRLCHATGMEGGLCVYLDTQTGVVMKIFESGA